MTQDNDESEYKSGEELVAAFNLPTREARLERAVICLMEALDELHEQHKKQSLKDNLHNPDIFCSCADAYRIGATALAQP